MYEHICIYRERERGIEREGGQGPAAVDATSKRRRCHIYIDRYTYIHI